MSMPCLKTVMEYRYQDQGASQRPYSLHGGRHRHRNHYGESGDNKTVHNATTSIET